MSDNAAKATGEQFLGHLMRPRDRLDGDIERVKELLEVL